MIQDTNTHQKHPHCSMWKPRIPLHQYLDTEYVSILNKYRTASDTGGLFDNAVYVILGFVLLHGEI